MTLLLAVPWLIDVGAWRLALLLTLVALLLTRAPFWPGFGEEPGFKPKIPRGFALLDHRSLAYPKAPGIYGYELRMKPTRNIQGLHCVVITDVPLLHAQLTFEQVIQSELQGAWGVDAERLHGRSAVFAFSRPSLNQSFDLWVRVDATAPVRILRIRLVDKGPAGTEALDLAHSHRDTNSLPNRPGLL